MIRLSTIWLIMLGITIIDIVCFGYDLGFRWPGPAWDDLAVFCIILTAWRCIRGAAEPAIHRWKTGNWSTD